MKDLVKQLDKKPASNQRASKERSAKSVEQADSEESTQKEQKASRKRSRATLDEPPKEAAPVVVEDIVNPSPTQVTSEEKPEEPAPKRPKIEAAEQNELLPPVPLMAAPPSRTPGGTPRTPQRTRMVQPGSPAKRRLFDPPPPDSELIPDLPLPQPISSGSKNDLIMRDIHRPYQSPHKPSSSSSSALNQQSNIVNTPTKTLVAAVSSPISKSLPTSPTKASREVQESLGPEYWLPLPKHYQELEEIFKYPQTNLF